MAHLLANYPITSIWVYGQETGCLNLKSRKQGWVKCLCAPTEQEVRLIEKIKVDEKWLVNEYGWKVRRLVEEATEMKKVALIQAEAFHEPMALFDDYFFQFFQAEVLAGLIYKLKNSPPDRYACLVAECSSESSTSTEGLVGVVDVTALRDDDVLQHLQGAEEYLYISGLAVLKAFRRQKIATVLLQACEVLSIIYGFQYLALRAYEDDLAAQKLYANAGYTVVTADPPWFTTWIGRKRRVLMIKRSAFSPPS